MTKNEKKKLLADLTRKKSEIQNSIGKVKSQLLQYNTSNDRDKLKSEEFNLIKNLKSIELQINLLITNNLKTVENNEIEIDWSEIVFHSNKIGFKNHVNQFIYLNNVKSSFNNIRKIFSHRLPKLKIRIENEKISLIDKVNVDSIITYIQHIDSVQEYFIQNNKVIPLTNTINTISNKSWFENIKLNKINGYFQRIADKYSNNNFFEEYKIIPVVEICRHYSNTDIIKYEETFFFTYKNNDNEFPITILWESTEEGKASYKAKCNENDYSDKLNALYTFATDPNNLNRREHLERTYNKAFVQRLEHNSQWKYNI